MNKRFIKVQSLLNSEWARRLGKPLLQLDGASNLMIREIVPQDTKEHIIFNVRYSEFQNALCRNYNKAITHCHKPRRRTLSRMHSNQQSTIKLPCDSFTVYYTEYAPLILCRNLTPDTIYTTNKRNVRTDPGRNHFPTWSDCLLKLSLNVVIL